MRLLHSVRERAYEYSDKNYLTVTLEEVALKRKYELAWKVWSRQDNIRSSTY